MYTQDSRIEEPETDWYQESYDLSARMDSSDPDDDDDNDADEEEDEQEEARKDWGETDPLDSPNQPWTPMDPTGPGSAV